ncbi:nucleotide exchange factor GrpE [Marinobacterium lutimaris]|uniref:Protein GrpE n=1 Tax=Marinobacterium lutimaris TaxID=568106 RepID=A0A1H6D813_9GAMM|nr:nucleotide exchange factor GrpE [Marinobacterium lutimaris]SEG81003.1 molecular chaperone GrpE [Marinobacterium lutimaris]
MSDEQQKQTETPEQVQPEQILEPAADDVEIQGDEAVDAETLKQQLAQAEAEIADLQKQLAELQPRAQAEIQNMRRRAEQDVEKARKFALEKFAGELLPVMDSLERAIEACQAEDEATKSLKEGVEMTHKLFLDGMGKFNVETVDPTGEAFNPEHHQAMSLVDAPDAEPNTVVAVMQKGYLLNGRLIRPAMVMVAKG